MCEVMKKYEDAAEARGLAKGIRDSAVAMLKNGIDPEMVAKCSGLPMSKILELAKT